MTEEDKKISLKLAIRAYRQAIIDTHKIIEEIFIKSIDLYDKKLEEFDK